MRSLRVAWPLPNNRPAEQLQHMYSKRTLVRIVMLAISGPLAMLVTVASVTAQNLPPPGAYQAIPNFIGVGAGLQFRQAINDRFSGAQRVAPAIATVSFANLPLEQDGTLLYCQDCKLTSPCVASETGAWALGARCHWSCASGPLEASLNANGSKLTNLANGTVSGDASDFGGSAGSDLSGTLSNPTVQTVLGRRLPLYRSEPNASLNDSALSTIGTATTATGQPAVNMTLNKPSTVVAGNTMIMAYSAQSASAPTPPTGWTLIRSDSCAGGALGSYYKVAGSSEPSSYTWTSPAACYVAALIDVGATASNPVDTISPIACGGTPTIAGLSTSSQPENVIVIGAGANGNVSQVGFSQGELAVLRPASGGVPLSIGYLTSNYPTSPALALTGGGAAEVAQMIAIRPASTYTGSPVLQGDGYVELTKLHGKIGTDSSISHFNINGDFNVKNPIYGAKGDGLTDDTAAIQAAINAAQNATVNNPISGPVVYFPVGHYKVGGIYPNYQPVTLEGPLLGGTAPGITLRGDGAQVSGLVNGETVPSIFVEPLGYATTVLGTGADAWTASPLVGSTGASLNWGTGTPSNRFLNLKDLNQANGKNAIGEEAGLINGISSYDYRHFIQYPSATLTSGDYYYIANAVANDGINNTTVFDVHMIAGSTPSLSCTLNLSDGAHTVGGSVAGFTAGTPHVVDCNLDGIADTSCTAAATPSPCCTGLHTGSCAGTGTNTMNFFIDGTKVGTSSSVTPGAYIVSPPSVQFLIGEINQGVWSDNTGGANSHHWIGQIYSLQISNKAYNTSNYTAPTTAFTSDANTWLLLNGTHINDVWMTVDTLIGGSGAIAFHTENLAGGNQGATIQGLATQNGVYGLEAIGPLYMKLDNDYLEGTESGIHIENNSYGGRWDDLRPTTSSYGESAFELFHNSGLINVSGTLNMITGAYGGIVGDSNFTTGGAFSQGANSYNVAMWSIYGDTPYFKTTLTGSTFDNEGGSPLSCYQISGTGSVSIIDSDCQTISTNVPIQWYPSNSGGSLQLIGDSFETNGGSPAAILKFNGSATPLTPATFIDDVVNNINFDNIAIPACSDMTKCSRLDSSFLPPSTTVANLPVCTNCQPGIIRQVTDCNANCTTYLGTSFTGGGSTRSTVQWNGSAWELH